MEKHSQAYDSIYSDFSFLFDITASTDHKTQCANDLRKKYPNDLESSLANEIIHFHALNENVESDNTNNFEVFYNCTYRLWSNMFPK